MKQARIVVVEYIYHQLPGQQPIAVENRFSRQLASLEDPYFRRLTVGREWLALDTGWVKSAGLVSLCNEMDKPVVNLSAAEHETWQKRQLQVSVGEHKTGCLLLLPGESLRIQPEENPTIWLRVHPNCPVDTLRCALAAFPT